MKLIFRFVLYVAFCLTLIFYFGCASSQNLNDFFGIEMPEEEADKFKIVSYDQDRGANYYSNSRMNTHLYAWAEIQPQILGDVVISVDTASRQAQEMGHDLDKELTILLVHGILHLAGYDHMQEEDARKMKGMERMILKEIEPI